MVLNKVVRIIDNGLVYEPGPRHAEPIARDFGLAMHSKYLVTPKAKPTCNEELHAPTDPSESIIDSMRRASKHCCPIVKKPLAVRVDGNDYVVGTPCYRRPHQLKHMMHEPIRASTLVSAPNGHDLFTSLAPSQPRDARSQLLSQSNTRYLALNTTLKDGAAWNVQTPQLIHAVPKVRNKRGGVKARQATERLKHVHGALGPEGATLFRAVPARANDLALDRLGIAVASKELCRCFAAPAREAFDALTQLGGYLIGIPGLVWDFLYQPKTDSRAASVDTEFAGCRSTQRLTSGRVCMGARHLLRHWSTTQSTMTLSSAEAGLSGICRGSSQSRGLSSIVRDLGGSVEPHRAS